MENIPRKPIVDTGPLFDFLLWRFSVDFKIQNLSSELRFLTNDPYKKSVQWYLGEAKPITTCPEVIAEIHRHAEQKLRQPHLGSFWKFAQQELTQLGLNEKLVELVQMNGDILSFLGPTDTALLQIADAAPNSSQRVFTEDGDLIGQCRKKGVSVLRISKVLSIWQQYGSQQ